jgi:hypothetical protein
MLDPVTIRVRPVKGEPWEEPLACYRSFSQFHSRPIFWIDPQFENRMRDEDPVTEIELVQALSETLYHEYGHVIWEMADWGRPRLGIDTTKLRTLISSTHLAQEDFCEAFLRFWRGWTRSSDPKPYKFKRILVAYRQLAFTGKNKLT